MENNNVPDALYDTVRADTRKSYGLKPETSRLSPQFRCALNALVAPTLSMPNFAAFTPA
jgi:hypothetical protein